MSIDGTRRQGRTPASSASGVGWLSTVCITEVWAALSLAPLRHNRGRAEWRGGKDRNVSVDPESGTWFDFVQGEGGGILDLVQLARGCDRPAAVEWLVAAFGIRVSDRQDGTFDPHERELRRARREEHLEIIRLWALGLRLELERVKARGPGRPSSVFAWQRACRHMYLLQEASEQQLWEWSRAARRKDARRWRQLIRIGRREVAFNENLCAALVGWMGDAEARIRESRRAA